MLLVALWNFIMLSTLFRPAASFVARNSFQTLPLNMVSSLDSLPLTTRASNEQEKDELVLDPLVVCGPSGVGKGTIIEKYMTEHGGSTKFGFTVSHTTRLPRPGEEHGIHYHFVAFDDMQRDIIDNKFLEHAEVHGNLYGTSWESMKHVHQSGKRCLLDIDVQGVIRLKSLEQQEQQQQVSTKLAPTYIFIAPPSLEILQQRLQDRNTESVASLEKRTRNAKREVDYGLEPGNFDYIIVNDNLEDAVKQFAQAINDAYRDLQ
jgi:guanylate kinase